MAYPESHESCGGKVGERRMALMNINSMGFSALSSSGLPARMKARKAKDSRKRISITNTKRRCCLSHDLSSNLRPAVLDSATNKYERLKPPRTRKPNRIPPTLFCVKPSEVQS